MRNALEERGHFPLLFFLRCLTDESELESLLQREIEARDFFLLCNSENAAASRFVAEEVDYIKSLAGKIYETVDLDSNWEAQIEAIHALSRRATVSSSHWLVTMVLIRPIPVNAEERLLIFGPALKLAF